VNFEVEGDKALEMKLDATPKGIGSALVAAFVKVGLGLEAHLKREELSGQALGVRTGGGRRSTFYRVQTGSDRDVEVVIGNDLRKAKYMRAQNDGATIVPKTSQYLAIPIGNAKTAKGVTRFSARQVISSPGSFGYTGTFVKNGIIFGHKGNDAKPEPLFALKRRVTLKAVGFLAHTLSEKREWANGQVSTAVSGVLEKK
jgi:hypothetical protein